jgi:hypothetical protein
MSERLRPDAWVKKTTRQRGGPTLIQRSRSVSSMAKGFFHCESCAGKGRVIRDFMQLAADDTAVVLAECERMVDAALQ